MADSHKFQFQCLSVEDAWSLPRPRFVLDTNVVPAFQSVAVRGYLSSIPEHVRVAHLLKRMSGLGANFGVDSVLDGIEGSSFHRGGSVDAYNAVRREAAVRGLCELSSGRLDTFLASGDALGIPTTVAHSRTIAERIEFFRSERAWLFYPAYAVSLVVRAWHEADRRSNLLPRLQRLRDEISLIPDAPVLAALLLEHGTARVRADLAQGVFKVHDRDIRGACLSAAWDLTYLNYVALIDSTARMHDHPIEEQPRSDPDAIPVLVTQDKPLAKLATMIRMLDTRSPAPERRLRLNVPFEFLLNGNRTPLNVARGTLNPSDNLDPDGDRSAALIRAINDLEEELRVPLTDPDPFDASVNVEADWTFVHSLLEVAHADLGHLLTRARELQSRGHKVLLQSIKLATLLVHEDARVHERTVADSLVSLINIKDGGAQSLPMGALLVVAATQETDGTMMMNAALKKITIDGDDVTTEAELLILVQRGLASIAEAQGVDAQEIARRIQTNIERDGLHER